ncbi:MAG TPA: (d)CMP kinase [Rhodopila sp.]
MTTKPVIAIDGPSAAGKGTLARRLASTLGLPYLDTGLLYRAVGRRVVDAGGDPSDAATAERAARSLHEADLDRSDLREPVVDAAASAVAAFAGVRAALLAFQRNFATQAGAVLDGRDIGTMIFPDAAAKLFVTASPAERARRRWLELRGRGVDADLTTVEDEMSRRDARDTARAAAPLRAADDAYQLNTSEMDAEAVFQAALAYIRKRTNLG